VLADVVTLTEKDKKKIRDAISTQLAADTGEQLNVATAAAAAAAAVGLDEDVLYVACASRLVQDVRTFTMAIYAL